MTWLLISMVLIAFVVFLVVIVAYDKGHRVGYAVGYDEGYVMRPLEELEMPTNKRREERNENFTASK